MERVHKQNYTIILIGIALLSVMSLFAYGLTAAGFLGVGILVGSGILSTICKAVIKDDLMKAVGITVFPAIATLIYSGVQGGNPIAFLANYVFLAMMAAYFERKQVIAFAGVIGGISLICAVFWPQIIEGPEGSVVHAVTKVILFLLMAGVLVNSTTRGHELLDTATDTLEVVKQNEKTATDIAENLNGVIASCRENVEKLSVQAESVNQAATQMGTVVENTTGATVTVGEKVTGASEQIEKNYELAKNLEDNFVAMNQVVSEGDTEANLVKENLQDMSEVVASAQDATETLLEEMKRITDILGQINAIASQTSLLSLNASIEAARAGEHGRGFAVVADEIRALAEQSTQAAGNIKNILDGLANTTNDVATKISEGAQAAVGGVEKMTSLLGVFETIRKSTEDAHGVVQEEYGVIEDVRQEFGQIQAEVETLVASTEENTAMIENIVESIAKQKDSVEGVEGEITNISELSDTLRIQFKQKKEEVR